MSKWVLITGASSGIGHTVALSLAKLNWNVFVSARNETLLDELCYECSNLGVEAKKFVYDLSNVENLADDLSTLLIKENIKIDAFVHSAGSTEVLPIKNLSYLTALKIFNINFFSAQQIVSILSKKKINGSSLKNIIFISALIGNTGAKYQSSYCASKAALDSFTNTLAMELAPNIRVNSILPGSIQTKIAESAFSTPDIKESIQKRQLLGEGSVEDIAKLVSFLLSDGSKWITGQHIGVDGGESLRQ